MGQAEYYLDEDKSGSDVSAEYQATTQYPERVVDTQVVHTYHIAIVINATPEVSQARSFSRPPRDES